MACDMRCSVAVTALVISAMLQQSAAAAFDSRNVVFVIVSQSEPYYASMAAWLKADIERQVYEVEQQNATVYLTHEAFPVPGAWTIVPLLRPLLDRQGGGGGDGGSGGGGDVRWVMFLEPHTAVRYTELVRTFKGVGDQDATWVGYPLTDAEPTIIHHFSIFQELDSEEAFTYPNLASGFALSMQLIQELVHELEEGGREREVDFSIDPAFELAQLIYGNRSDPARLMMGELSFCVVSGEQCTTYPKPYDVCGEAIPEDSIFFAVKTWSGFHESRARVVKDTWGALVTHLQFFSDKEGAVREANLFIDSSLPATNIGVPNTETGHCAKTVAILKYLAGELKAMPQIKWIFLADDDTILGVRRLREYLSCLRGGETESVVGERYGYGYGNKQTAEKGYDYITGGGGIAISASAAATLARCVCPSASAPDDMTLGACAKFRFNLTVTHSPLFHQARPQDYSQEYLARDRPISFHKHWMVDPVAVYREWFAEEYKLTVSLTHTHDEDGEL